MFSLSPLNVGQDGDARGGALVGFGAEQAVTAAMR
jgi:hypothetical protein